MEMDEFWDSNFETDDRAVGYQRTCAVRRHHHRHQHSNYLTADHTAADCAVIRTYTNTNGPDGQSVICSRYLLSMKFFEVGKEIVPQKRRKCSKKRF